MAVKFVTFRYLANSAYSVLKQNFADADIQFKDIVFWVKIAVNNIKKDKFAKTKFIGNRNYLFIPTAPVQIHTDQSGGIYKGKKYIALPKGVFDLDYSAGIDFIKYAPPPECNCEKAVSFEASTYRQIELMYSVPHEKPTWDRPYFVQSGNILTCFGIEALPIENVSMNLLVTEDPSLESTNYDDEIILDDEDIAVVLQAVVDFGRFMILIPQERVEEGADNRNIPAYKQAAPYTPTEQPQQ